MQSSFSPQTFNLLLQGLQPSTDALQRQIPSIHAIDPNPPQQAGFTGFMQREAPGASNFASQLFSDTLKMIAPVGQSPNDEQLLVMALQSGLNQGLDHRRAIERLHGVCPPLHVPHLPLISEAGQQSRRQSMEGLLSRTQISHRRYGQPAPANEDGKEASTV
jgi:hypothetical protein